MLWLLCYSDEIGDAVTIAGDVRKVVPFSDDPDLSDRQDDQSAARPLGEDDDDDQLFVLRGDSSSDDPFAKDEDGEYTTESDRKIGANDQLTESDESDVLLAEISEDTPFDDYGSDTTTTGMDNILFNSSLSLFS